jgi:hypothetical protein
MREAFPWDEAPQYMLRDRDAIYGTEFADTTRDMGLQEVLRERDQYRKQQVGYLKRRAAQLGLQITEATVAA